MTNTPRQHVIEEFREMCRENRIKGYSDHTILFKESVESFILTALTEAEKRGRNESLDYILKHSEEAVQGLFYVTNSTIQEARSLPE